MSTTRKFTATTTEPERAWREFRKALSESEPRELPRSYGFELEAPFMENLQNALFRAGFDTDTLGEFKPDSSVEGDNDDCNCDCYACTYHECDCEHCENSNSDPEHDCGYSECVGAGEWQEFASAPQTNTHGEVLTALEVVILPSVIEPNDSCGLHVHVSASDLNWGQLANLQTAIRAIRPNLTRAIFGRGFNHYAREISNEDLAQTRKGEPAQRYLAVNTFRTRCTKGREDCTTEFRLGAGTNDPAQIRAVAVFAVALTEYARKGSAPYWLSRCQTIEELLNELGITL